MKVSRYVAALGLSLCFSSAIAQLPGITPNPFKLRVSAGYGFSPEFRNRSNQNVRLEGPYLGIELPVTALLGFDVALGASAFFGGRMKSGPDADAEVYRFVATARKAFGSGTYIKGGIGFAHSSPRGNSNLDGASGTVLNFGIGTPLASGMLRRVTPNLELNIFASNHAQLRGAFIGLTFGL